MDALAYERGEEYDPSEPIAPDLLEALSLVEHARPVIAEHGPYEKARQRRRERRQLRPIPERFSAQDLITEPCEREALEVA